MVIPPGPCPLPRSFYLRDALEVARDLLGKELVRVSPDGVASGVIVETEAYLGAGDRASHAFGGRPTPRTSVMYEEGGRAYVYLIYGMHWCLNLVTGGAGVPQCVLIRALEPLQGVPLMRRRRGCEKLEQLANGPGKLCRALDIDSSLYGADLCGEPLFVRSCREVPPAQTAVSPRVNIDYAAGDRNLQARFFIRSSRFRSRS